MPVVRAIAADLHDADVVEMRQKGRRVPDPRAVRGLLRLARGQASEWP